MGIGRTHQQASRMFNCNFVGFLDGCGVFCVTIASSAVKTIDDNDSIAVE